MPRLIVIKGADLGKQFDLTEPLLSVGRDATNQIRLHDTEISRRHAEFRQTDSGYTLCDVGSANGTFVNQEAIKEVTLHTGDHVQVGQTVLIYSAGRNDSAATSDLAERISMISRQDLEMPAAIVKTVSETEGSRILSQPQEAGTAWLQSALANLAVMYEAIHTVSHILDLDQLLEKIMDLIFRSIAADRGCIMLRHPDTNQFEPKAVRWRQPRHTEEKIALSRTIMDYVLRNREGVLVSDAVHDQRFSAGQSILRYGIREAICVPMKGRHESLGVLYLDTHTPTLALDEHETPPSKFTEDHLKLAIAIAHQAALAVEDTRYHEAMVQAERLAAIGQTVAALSHHIKNILQGLRSGGEILKIGMKEKDEALLNQGWKIVEKNQGKIYDLVMDMLSYSKEREPAVEETDLHRIVRDVMELMQGRAQELGVSLECRLDESLPPLNVDPEGIHRALLNVVGNALDAVEGRSRPQVSIATLFEKEAGFVQIIVLDNGVGIPAPKLATIFRPFVSTKGSKGTGLGLAVSRKILQEHGGDILVHSQPGKGSKFTLRLPLKSLLSPDPGQTGTVMKLMPPFED